MKNLWDRSHDIQVQTGPEIVGGFSVGFDKKIPEETRGFLMDFVYWVEDHYHLPITLWVDFEYRHYLVSKAKKRVGYLFYWVDTDLSRPFENEADIPVIRLPVRTEHWSREEILRSFIEGISDYFHWLAGGNVHGYEPEEALVEEILDLYCAFRDSREEG